MKLTISFDIMNSSDWWDEDFSIEANTIEEARSLAIKMANDHYHARNIQSIYLLLPDGEKHFCDSGNMNRTTFRKIVPPDFGDWYVIPAHCPAEQS
jgi:hypothetical protein